MASRPSLWRTPRTRALLLVATVGAIVWLGSFAARVYTDVLWYRELGQERVIWTTLTFRLLGPATVGLGTTCAMLLNFAVVERLTRGAPAPQRRALAAVWRYRALVYPVVAIACGLAMLDEHDEWRTLLLWAHRSDFGVSDPLFGRDVGFFVFSLPLYREIAGWLQETLVMMGAVAVAAYAIAGARPARSHLLAILALLLLVTAWRLRLDRFALAVPHDRSIVPGASYTDVHVRLPALQALSMLALAASALCAYAAFRRIRLAPLAAIAIAIGAMVVVAAVNGLPALVERFDVAPQALARERPYVGYAIDSTRRAFALDDVDVRPLPAGAALTRADLAAERSTIANVPLWDPGVLRPAMNELQTIGGYYGFPSTTVDRYTIDGSPRLMTIGARQLDLTRLRASARTWANTHFAYTHGYGVAAVEGGRATADRYPSFVQREFGSEPLRLTEPRIYFGEGSPVEPPYVVLNSGRGEVEQPQPGSQAPEYHYDGPGGIALSNPIRRLAFAARFGDLKLLLTGTATAESRIVIHRDARERVRTLAPFLHWDGRPQTAVFGGRVQFLFHGYTTSADYPYASRVTVGRELVNYIRASALAVVDAFSGQVTLYAVDEDDPILRAWRGAYPTLLRPGSEMPAALRSHLRYPRRLFAAQAEAYATYHASDPTGFWNGADAWQPSHQLAGPVEDAGEIQFPDPEERLDDDERRDGHVDPSAWRVRPTYLLARLPGDTRERLVLAAPFSPRGRQNLVSYFAASVDRTGRPRLTLLSLPRDRLTIGPSQATREILSEPAVIRRLQLLNRESRDLGDNSVNRTVLGAVRVVPLGDALVHVQPIYVISGGSGVPRLQLVTAYANGRVGYGRDLMAALRRLADR